MALFNRDMLRVALDFRRTTLKACASATKIPYKRMVQISMLPHPEEFATEIQEGELLAIAEHLKFPPAFFQNRVEQYIGIGSSAHSF